MIAAVRSRAIASTAVVNTAAGIARPLVSLLTLPALLHALDLEGLGVWMIALSVMGMIGFFNAGLSSAVVTAVGRAGTRSDTTHLGELVTATTAVAVGFGLVTAAVCVPIALLVDWQQLFSLSKDGPGRGDLSPLMVVLAIGVSVGYVAAVPRQIMLGRQHGYLAHALDIGGVVTSAIALLIAAYMKQPLHVLAIAYLLPQYAVMFLGGLYYLGKSGIPLFQVSRLNRPTLRRVTREAATLSLYQASFAISSQSDLLLIGLVFGASASTGYGIAQRVFSLPLMVTGAVNHALWPALARADAAGRIDWVERTYRRTLLATVGAAALASLALFAAYEPLVGIWLRTPVAGEPLIMAGMVCWNIVGTAVLTSDTLLRARQATGVITRQMVLMMVVNLAASIVLLRLIGPAGAIFGSVIGYVTCLLVPYVIEIRKIFHSAALPQGSAAADLVATERLP